MSGTVKTLVQAARQRSRSVLVAVKKGRAALLRAEDALEDAHAALDQVLDALHIPPEAEFKKGKHGSRKGS